MEKETKAEWKLGKKKHSNIRRVLQETIYLKVKGWETIRACEHVRRISTMSQNGLQIFLVNKYNKLSFRSG